MNRAEAKWIQQTSNIYTAIACLTVSFVITDLDGELPPAQGCLEQFTLATHCLVEATMSNAAFLFTMTHSTLIS